MKIVYISPSYYPNVGGIEYVVQSLAELFVTNGSQISIICGEWDINKPILENGSQNIKILRWPVFEYKNSYFIPKNFVNLKKCIKNLVNGADVIHAHGVHSVFSVYSALIANQANPSAKLILTTHYHGEVEYRFRKGLWKLWRLYVKRLTGLADVVQSVSDVEAKQVLKDFHNIRKFRVIPNGVNEDVLQYQWRGRNSDYIFYSGRIESYKGVESVIDVAENLGLRVVVAGRGSHLKAVIKYANSRTKVDAKFIDFQERHEYLRLLSGARYAANFSKMEAFSLFVAEALSIGVPVITTSDIASIYGIQHLGRLALLCGIRVKTWNELFYDFYDLYSS
jgi:1,2-diacylglycerol 3-alpha-glucosyltransferase